MTDRPDQPEHPGHSGSAYRIAVVGAGPAGLFAAQALIAQDRLPVLVDLYDRLPTPFGLLRYGVAPDQEGIRSVAGTLTRVFDSDRVRFLGTVEIGRDVDRDRLLADYDAVLWATGSAGDLLLHIPGEHLPGSRSARQFVAWYGGHPDARAQSLRGVEAVACIGVGNVAVDVARILAQDPDRLASTDIPQPVLAQLRSSPVRDIWIVGRRGPEHASFTPRELRSLLDLPDVEVTVDPPIPAALDGSAAGRRERTNLAVLRAAVARPAPAVPRRRVHLVFWARPVAVEGADRVHGLTLERTAPGPDGRPIDTGARWTVPVQLVLRAIGYRGVALAGLPFDARRGIVPNEEGRVLGTDGRRRPREYVTGWIKRGPIGVIGTNKSDAAQTVAHLLADLVGTAPTHPHDPLDDLATQGVRPTTFADWLAIDAAEVEEGRRLGRPRVKITGWDELIRLCREAERSRVTDPGDAGHEASGVLGPT